MKLLGALAAVAVLGAAAAAVALRAFFPEPKLRAMVVDGARKQLGREVRLEHIGLGLRGLSLTGLRVSESPDFAAGTFVSVERFRVRPSWRALLRKKLVVSSVSAEGMKLVLLKGADGAFNFSSLAAAAPAPGAPAPAAAPAERPEFSISHLRLSGAEVLYKDAASKQQWQVSEADVALDGFSMNAPFDLDASLRLRGEAGGRPLDARVAFDGEVDPARGELARLKLKAKSFSVEAEGLKLKGSADVDGLEPPKARFDAELSASGKGLLEASGEVRLSSAAGGDFLADVKAESAGLDTMLIAKWLPGTVPAVSLPAASLTLKAERKGTSLDVKAFALKWADGKADGRVSAKGFGTPSPAYDGKVVLDLVLPALAKGQYPFLKLPPDLSLPSAKVQGAVELHGDSARLDAFKVTVPQGSVTVSGAVARLGSPKPLPDLALRVDLDLPSVKAGELPVALPPSVPASLVLPPVKIDGALAVKGEDVRLHGLEFTFPTGKAKLGGAALGALGARLRPELELTANVSLPALTDKDLPFAGVPAGLKLPPSSWELDLDYTLERLRVRALRLKTGGNDVAIEGTVGDPAGRMAYDLLVKARTLVFHELTQLTPATRELELKGAGFAALSVTGAGAKPVFAGKAQFKEAGATVAGLPLSEFNGTVSFDADRIDVPNVKGKVADGALEADLTVQHWSKEPQVWLDASLDRFDLGRFLDAKKRYAAEHPPKPAAPAAPGKPAAAPPAIRSKGTFNVGSLQHPQATLGQLKSSWDLTGIGSDLRPLSGTARFSVAGGRLKSAREMGASNPALKVLTLPLAIFQGLGRAAMGIPDLSDIEVRAITGDYLIQNGVMHVRESHLDSEKADVRATGSVDLPKEALDLVVTAQVGRVAPPIDIQVRGTVSEPKTKLKVGKAIADGLQNLLQNITQPK
jgi:hypothetical protein